VPRFGPISRDELIRCFHDKLYFDGPIRKPHGWFSELGTLLVKIPPPEHTKVSEQTLDTVLKQARISRQRWESL